MMGRTRLYSRLSLSRLEGGELSIKGTVVTAYCLPFFLLMAALLFLPGLLLTVVAWRPELVEYYRSYYDLGEEWSSRIDQISRVRVAGPALISVSLIMMLMNIRVAGPALISVSLIIMMILRMIMPGW